MWFQYSAGRRGQHPARHLKDWQGILQAYAFAGYNQLYASGRIVEAACWSPARRKLWDIHERQHKLPQPILKDLQVWMNETLTQVSAKSPLAQAIGYAVSNWTALVRFVGDGRVEAENNAAERALRADRIADVRPASRVEKRRRHMSDRFAG